MIPYMFGINSTPTHNVAHHDVAILLEWECAEQVWYCTTDPTNDRTVLVAIEDFICTIA